MEGKAGAISHLQLPQRDRETRSSQVQHGPLYREAFNGVENQPSALQNPQQFLVLLFSF